MTLSLLIPSFRSLSSLFCGNETFRRTERSAESSERQQRRTRRRDKLTTRSSRLISLIEVYRDALIHAVESALNDSQEKLDGIRIPCWSVACTNSDQMPWIPAAHQRLPTCVEAERAILAPRVTWQTRDNHAVKDAWGTRGFVKEQGNRVFFDRAGIGSSH